MMLLTHRHGSVCSLSNTHYVINNNYLTALTWIKGFSFYHCYNCHFKQREPRQVADMSRSRGLVEPRLATWTAR